MRRGGKNLEGQTEEKWSHEAWVGDRLLQSLSPPTKDTSSLRRPHLPTFHKDFHQLETKYSDMQAYGAILSDSITA